MCVGVCRNLKSIVVQIGIEDYFEDPNSPEARKLFDEMVNKLQVTATSSLSEYVTLDDILFRQIKKKVLGDPFNCRIFS